MVWRRQLRDRVRILDETILSENWGLVKTTRCMLQRGDGSWQEQRRETYDRGDGAAILLYCPARRTVILTRQFRFPAYTHGDAGWLVEVPAGKLEGDSPADCALKEAEEETGYRVTDLTLVCHAYMSPGSVTEKLSLFVAAYDAEARVSDGGGLAHEGEDIEVLELGLDEAVAMMRRGEIADAKSIILLQYLLLEGLVPPA